LTSHCGGGQEPVADAPSAPEEIEAMTPSPDAVAAEADPAPAPEHEPEPELVEAAPDAAAVAAPPAPEATAQARINSHWSRKLPPC